jgi:hypothetical protein
MGAAFRCRVGEFQTSTALEKLGHLISASASAGFASHLHTQTTAWKAELDIVARLAAELVALVPNSASWSFLFEYEIPRRERRPDLVLLADDVVYILEFKIGGDSFLGADEWQVYSYALDLRDFHAASRDRVIVPLLIATSVPDDAVKRFVPGTSAQLGVLPTQQANAHIVAAMIASIHATLKHDPSRRIDPESWDASAYRPTPTIIEAAEQLFAGHNVADISHSFATNLDLTTNEIVRAVETAQKESLRTICFVTGTPGAGKTLAGLNAAHNPALRRNGRPSAVFLSGNGPLVRIVRQALVRDQKLAGLPKGEASRVVSAFVANVHGFLVQHGIRDVSQPPPEHAIVFDEAQRAWNATAVMKKHDVDRSEPGMLLDIMERAANWCTVIALVGAGQEIHQGEAGLEEWGIALNERAARWRVMASPELLHGNETVAGHRLFASPPSSNIELVDCPALHLTVSVRSPRARLLGQWVDGLLNNRPDLIGIGNLSAEFPVVYTRELSTARRWLNEHSDAKQRAGLLASSGALRLRAHGIEVSSGFRKGYSYADWFLTGPGDTRSSTRLEVAATEFECQGLELDWTCVCWGDDFVVDPQISRWICRSFRGTKWQRVGKHDLRRYVLNKYRVLLTGSRKGMVIWVPHGDADDPTRDPSLLDATAAYFGRTGIPEL